MGLYCQNQNKEGQAVLSAGYEEELMEHLVFIMVPVLWGFCVS